MCLDYSLVCSHLDSLVKRVQSTLERGDHTPKADAAKWAAYEHGTTIDFRPVSLGKFGQPQLSVRQTPHSVIITNSDPGERQPVPSLFQHQPMTRKALAIKDREFLLMRVANRRRVDVRGLHVILEGDVAYCLDINRRFPSLKAFRDQIRDIFLAFPARDLLPSAPREEWERLLADDMEEVSFFPTTMRAPYGSGRIAVGVAKRKG